MRHYSESAEDRADQRHRELVKKIAWDLNSSLRQHEKYFFQKIIKKLRIDEQNFSSKIQRTIHNVLVNDPKQYLQNTDTYKNYAYVAGTQSDTVDFYIDELKKKFVEWLSDEEVDEIAISYMKFLKKKDPFLRKNEISDNKSDIDSFMDTIQKTNLEEYKFKKIKIFLDKLRMNKNINKPYSNKIEKIKLDSYNGINHILNNAPFSKKEIDVFEFCENEISQNAENLIEQYFTNKETGNIISEAERKEYMQQALSVFLIKYKEAIQAGKIDIKKLNIYLYNKNLI